MAKKNLTNALSLLDLIDKSSVATLKAFSTLDECKALALGFDWEQEDGSLPGALLEHVRNLRKNQRDPAEREADRVLRLASQRGAMILKTIAEQFNDTAKLAAFIAQDGGGIARAVWMRRHSLESARLFDAAESILNTSDLRGNKRLFDSFEVPGDEAPPFIWNDSVKKMLEEQLTQAMRLNEAPEVIHVELCDGDRDDDEKTHYLVVRFAGDQVSDVRYENRNRQRFWYYPARDATLVYAPSRRVIEAYANTLATRAPMADVLSRHGFKRALSNRPLNRTRYDLSRFAKPLVDVRLELDGAHVERLYLAEASALFGHRTDEMTLRMHSGADLHEAIGSCWSGHPFSRASALTRVRLVVQLVFGGETKTTELAIVVSDRGRCSLLGERDQRIRKVGLQLLERLGVRKPLNPGGGIEDPALIAQVARVLECALPQTDGFTLQQLGVDIDRFADEGILIEGERLTEKVVEVTPDHHVKVSIERCVDPDMVRYRDPMSGTDVLLPTKFARLWKIDVNWIREEIIAALGAGLEGARGLQDQEDPVFLGEVDIDGHAVALYFAPRMSNEKQFAKVDAALRMRSRPLPGIVLTTSRILFPFAGTNVVLSIEDVLAAKDTGASIDLSAMRVVYRQQMQAAMGGTSVTLKVSADGHSALLSIPGKAPWRVGSKAKILVLQRLVDADHSGIAHVNTKLLMDGTGCKSPSHLFARSRNWRQYMVQVQGTRAWQLDLSLSEEVVDDEDGTPEVQTDTASG